MKTLYKRPYALLGSALISLLVSMPVLASDESSGSVPADQPVSSPISAADAATICKDLSGDDRRECLRAHQTTPPQNSDSASSPFVPAPPPMNNDCSQLSDSEREACEKASRDNAS